MVGIPGINVLSASSFVQRDFLFFFFSGGQLADSRKKVRPVMLLAVSFYYIHQLWFKNKNKEKQTLVNNGLNISYMPIKNPEDW